MHYRDHHRSFVSGGFALPASLPAWLMIVLLAVPASFISTSVSCWLNSAAEESSPLTESEEASEEAAVATGFCRIINRSSALECRLQVERKPGPGSRLGVMEALRGAEHLGRNGCGAVLRC